jgi:hypothetical protein
MAFAFRRSFASNPGTIFLHVTVGNPRFPQRIKIGRRIRPGRRVGVGAYHGARRVRVLPPMTAAETCLKLAEELPGSLVESLIAQLRSGAAPAMPNPGYQGRIDAFLRSLPD